jgi:L-lactate utilization protein LutC
MTSSARDAFLQRVHQALQEGNRAGTPADIPPRGNIGYQGAGTDPVARFRDELTAAGGQPYLVGDREAAVAQVMALVRDRSARRALLGRGAFIDGLNLADRFRAEQVEVVSPDGLPAGDCRETVFAADIGITGVDYLIAETGSVALLARPAEPRSFSLLPPVHIAVAHHAQILPDLFDLFARLSARPAESVGRPRMPSCLSLITGPSKTGDIELRLVTGVHGPGEIHVVLVTK